MFICMQKINFIPTFFEILQRYYNFAILGNLGMPNYDQQKQYYQFVENFDLIIPTPLCKLVISGSKGMPGHTHQKQ